MDQDTAPVPSERVRLRRGAARGDHDRATIRDILDDALIAHVGVSTDDGPLVLPMAFGRTDDLLYLHGASANGLLRAAVDVELCATVTEVDGLVMARTPFHNSMNYRSVVIRGRGRRVDEPEEHLEALRLITDHVVATWDDGRPPNASDLRRTLVLALPLDEASAKVRAGDPVDEPEDLDGPHWAGTVDLGRRWGAPRRAADLLPGISAPLGVVERFGAEV
ncbi:MAG: pyridoxamine 5'-phosphate oxidase family protein [Actinomycetota bacterium]|nr:pyridoxamine 5'-phosphate oxidase family protein [Actinomycetota bacterium]